MSFNVIDTDRQDWGRGWSALKRFTQREKHARVPYDHREGAYPLGRWIAEQRRVFGAGQMTGERAARLEALGMVWDATDAAFEENVAAARVYYEQHWTLCCPRTVTALDKPLGQWISNLRRPGALAGHPRRAEALAAIDPDWNPTWSPEWQRHYAAVREMTVEKTALVYIEPGVTVHGMDVGKWLERQRQPAVWTGLMDGQRERLEHLGIQPLAADQVDTGTGQDADGRLRGLRAGRSRLAQYAARTGTVTVPRAYVEVLEDGSEVKLGIWLTNTKSRRAKLSMDQLKVLADLGLDWAT
ncbi:helicase associated domain-containing protein [Streptomyces sp. NPDC058612]|uniref:helicase associated domain-containing protein n=1 Tax=Streptomyces sp. NPDC058612 TaxID=3346555 RepID=UPI00365AAC42